MPKVVRPWVTAGVAAVGVATIVIAPASAPEDKVRIENSAVVQTETQGPLQYYPEVLSRSLSNARRLVARYLEDPLPVVTAIAENQHHAVTDVLRAAAELDPEAFAHAVLAAASQPVQSLGRVVAGGEPVHTANSLLVRLTMPAASGVLAGGAGAADVVDAVTDLDPVRVADGLLNLPARTVDGLLNGHVDGQDDDYFGLLGSVVEAPVSDQLSGPVDYLIGSLQHIGDTITTPASRSDATADPPPALHAETSAALTDDEDSPAPAPPTVGTGQRDADAAADDDARDSTTADDSSGDRAEQNRDGAAPHHAARHARRSHPKSDSEGPSA